MLGFPQFPNFFAESSGVRGRRPLPVQVQAPGHTRPQGETDPFKLKEEFSRFLVWKLSCLLLYLEISRADTIMVLDHDTSSGGGGGPSAADLMAAPSPPPCGGGGSGAAGDFSSSSAAAAAAAALDSVLKTEELPAPDTSAGTKEAFLK